MSWADTILKAGNNLVWRKIWAKAQKLRATVEKITEHFFNEMVTVGIDVLEPPDLGRFTPDWEPLSDSWSERKNGEEFFYYKGDLERNLLRKSTQGVFGRPQVFLEYGGKSIKVNAGQAPRKYDEDRLVNMKIRVVPFPKITGPDTAESLVAGGNDIVYYELMSKGSPFARPLVSPFVQWYTHVKVRQAMQEAIRG